VADRERRWAALPPAADGSSGLEPIPTEDVTSVNNDHVLSPDGKTIYFSAAGHLYRVPVTGGDPVRISNIHPAERRYGYWLHGVSPDESTPAYISVEPEGDDPRGRRNLPAAGGPDSPLTEGPVPYEGPEYSPDGKWIYYNSEEAATRPGHAQLFRMRPDGTGREQLTFDDRVNWFPHLSPDGAWIVYLSYAAGLSATRPTSTSPSG
jgi:Tol biopolymer transport system component